MTPLWFVSVNLREATTPVATFPPYSLRTVCGFLNVPQILCWVTVQAPVVRKVDSASGFPDTYPMDSHIHLLNNGAQAH